MHMSHDTPTAEPLILWPLVSCTALKEIDCLGNTTPDILIDENLAPQYFSSRLPVKFCGQRFSEVECTAMAEPFSEDISCLQMGGVQHCSVECGMLTAAFTTE